MDSNKIKALAQKIGVNWKKEKFSPETLHTGYTVELEHGKRDKQTNVTNDDPMKTLKIALKHLKETPLYYERLKKVEVDNDKK